MCGPYCEDKQNIDHRHICKNLLKHNCYYFARWTILPDMSKRSHLQSALIIGTGDDDGDAAVLVVGGENGNYNEAAILTNRRQQARGEQRNRGGQWRWQQLSPMQEKRPYQPGLLMLGRGRVLVCGGCWSRRAEILQLPRDDNDGSVWTLLTQEMTQSFWFTYLVNFNNRIVAVGESLITLVTTRSIKHLFTIHCLHLRQAQKVRRVDNNLHIHVTGKNSSTNRSLRALISNASPFFCLSGCATADLRVETAPKNTVRWLYLRMFQCLTREFSKTSLLYYYIF